MDPWEPVRHQLLHIEESGAYYAGGTLCVPYGPHRGGPEGKREVCLNRNGTGFTLCSEKISKNKRLYLPEDITWLVRIIYMMRKLV